MRIVGRYLVREIAVGVAFVLLGFLALFAFFDFINELDDIGKGGYRLQHALAHIVLELPVHIYELVPIAALIGAIYALAQFAQNSEFTAMRAAGLGRGLALRHILQAGLACAVITFVVGETLAPAAAQLGQRIRLSAIGASVTGQFRSGLWMKDSVRDAAGGAAGQRFVNVGGVLPDTSIRAVQVYEFDPDFRLRSILRADTGRFDAAANAWRLDGVRETRFVQTKGAADVPTVRAELVRDPERLWRSDLTPGIVGLLMLDPDRMAIWDLFPYIRHLRDNRQNTDRYEIALWRKIVYPFAAVVMMVLALPFAYIQVRAGGIGLKVFAGIMLGVGFHFANGLSSSLGLLNTWPAWLAVAMPNLVAAAFGLALLWRVERVR